MTDIKKKPLTAAQRKSNERARKRELGMIESQNWVYKEDIVKLKTFAIKLVKKREKLTKNS